MFFDKGLDLRLVNKDNVYDIINSDSKVNSNYGFLHIPKTGGTSVVDFIHNINDITESRPLLFFHSWDIDLIFQYFPNISLTFLIRDPLERIISGFQSRLRQGRPRYNQPWRAYEATAFSFFQNPESFIDALLRTDDFSLGTTEYALNNILAVSWNYKHYFQSIEKINSYASRFILIGKTTSLPSYISGLCKIAIRFESGIDQLDKVISLYTAKHQSPVPTSRILSNYSEDEIKTLKNRIASEYELYNQLLSITGI